MTRTRSREGLRLPRTPDPCALVIFGASGDLTARKLFPALYSLAVRDLLPEQFAIVGVARTPETDAEFRARMKEAVREFGRDKLDEKVWRRLAAGHALRLDRLRERGRRGRARRPAREARRRARARRGTASSTSPSRRARSRRSSTSSAAAGTSWKGWTRLIVEKPFGSDRASARQLNDEISHYFEEREIYRIDHYLGKETVQNLLALRFANGIFEPIWNRQFVDHVEITVAESIGIEGRASFYEQAGAIRDVFQNHLLQLVALTAMEPPVDFTAESVRNEKVKVLRAMRHARREGTSSAASTGAGYVEGKAVPGYREEPGVARGLGHRDVRRRQAATSTTGAGPARRSTCAPASGCRSARRRSRSSSSARRTRRSRRTSPRACSPNVLLVHVQPDEGVSLAIGAKVPGQGMTIRTVHMDFLYGGAFRTELPEAYERLILDCLLGDATLFTRADEVDEQWALVDSIVAAWKRDRTSFPNYDAGTWGPAAADELLRRDGREWRRR